MKIKTFESFNNQDYYQEISEDEYKKLKTKGNLVDIKSNIINIIKDKSRVNFDDIKLIEPFEVMSVDKLGRKGLYLSYKIRISGEMPPEHYEDYLERQQQVWVYELKDEWFIVYYQIQNISGSKYWNNKMRNAVRWKCDQLDGLMELFSKLGIIER